MANDDVADYQLKVAPNSTVTLNIRASPAADLSFQGHISLPNRPGPPPWKAPIELWKGAQQHLKKSLLFRDTIASGSTVQPGGWLSLSLMISNPSEKADPNYEFKTIIDLRSGNNGLHAIVVYHKWDVGVWRGISVQFT